MQTGAPDSTSQNAFKQWLWSVYCCCRDLHQTMHEQFEISRVRVKAPERWIAPTCSAPAFLFYRLEVAAFVSRKYYNSKFTKENINKIESMLRRNVLYLNLCNY